ncbi:hypothetical protein [Streptomyces sp. NPDC058466]|uniref:hypothetical protein n=1 Tax=unclassified Streptomyces TaxID=2593676 RepID=UPI0036683439
MTDLPYRDNTPVIAMISSLKHIALLSLPMLSLMRAAHRLRGAALGVIGALIPESGNALPPGRSSTPARHRTTSCPGSAVGCGC